MESDSKDGKKIKRKKKKVEPLQRYSPYVGAFLQSVWVRYRSVFPNHLNREFMEGQLRFVWSCGAIFWILFMAWKGIR